MLKRGLTAAGITFLVIAFILTVGLFIPSHGTDRTASYEIRLSTTSETPYTIIVPALVDGDDGLLGTADKMSATLPVALREYATSHGPGLEIKGNVSTVIKYECRECYADLSMSGQNGPPYYDSYLNVFLSSSVNFTIQLKLIFQRDSTTYTNFIWGVWKWGDGGCEAYYNNDISRFTTANWTQMPGEPETMYWDGFALNPLLRALLVIPFYIIGFVLLAAGLGIRKDKRLTCKACGSADLIPILYGLPESAVAEMQSTAREDGKPPYVFGGPISTLKSPRWQCNACGNRFGNLEDTLR